MVGVSPFYLLCTTLFLCFSDCFVLCLERDQRNPVNSPAKNDSPNQKYPFAKGYYSYFVQVNWLTNGYVFDPEIEYDVPAGHDVTLEPIKDFCQPNENPTVCEDFSTQQTKTGVQIIITDDLRTKIFNDSVAIFRLKAVDSTDQATVGGETTVLIKIEQSFHVTDTILKFDRPSYTLNIAYGRLGDIFKFQAKMVALQAEDNNTMANSQQSNDDVQLKEKQYEFNGNYALEYLPAGVSVKLKIDKIDGTLTAMGEINEGYYAFDVVASDYGPNSTTTLVGRSTVYLFVDRVAVCSSENATFIKAFTKDYMQEEIKLATVIPATDASSNCTYRISKQFPSGDFFQIDPSTGAVNVVNPVDRESSVFEGMDEPSVFLELRADCGKTTGEPPKEILPFQMPLDHILYDPRATVVQLVIDDVNDNPPVFPEKQITVGYPVATVASAVTPKYLVQVKATDKDAGKHGKIRFLLRSNDSEDFLINSETGTIYCTRLEEDVERIKVFEVLAKDTDDNKEGGGLESVLSVTVRPLTFEHIIRVFAKFDVTEDAQSLETQLSDISGYKVISLTHDVINVPFDQLWRLQRVMYVYGLNKDGSPVPASDLENCLRTVVDKNCCLYKESER
ncbi:protocadherin Fat 4-like isoform X2 [Adelges cooleyi]|uniref:protocadherin Fat 4-like isoform X2 n=1 Tax=Adelges cooleyi TaxID=133065 RepID=UPI0021805F5C|nr:protocadherin Fat 4-like isoform X2 [Adelges cooleyi]